MLYDFIFYLTLSANSLYDLWFGLVKSSLGKNELFGSIDTKLFLMVFHPPHYGYRMINMFRKEKKWYNKGTEAREQFSNWACWGGDTVDAGVNFVTESDTTVVNAVLDMRVLYSESSCFRIVSDLHANQLPNLQPHTVEDAAIATQNKHGGGGDSGGRCRNQIEHPNRGQG